MPIEESVCLHSGSLDCHYRAGFLRISVSSRGQSPRLTEHLLCAGPELSELCCWDQAHTGNPRAAQNPLCTWPLQTVSASWRRSRVRDWSLGVVRKSCPGAGLGLGLDTGAPLAKRRLRAFEVRGAVRATGRSRNLQGIYSSQTMENGG